MLLRPSWRWAPRQAPAVPIWSQCAHRRSAQRFARSATPETQLPGSLSEACKQLDSLLATDEEQALALATRLQQAGLMRAFGTVQQLPKRIYTIDELRLNKIEPERLLSPRDDSLAAVRTTAQVAAALGLGSLAYVAHWDAGQVLGTLVGGVFVLWCDQVANGGGGEALLIDTLGRLLRPQYAKRVAMHEAGHFLVAYLMGLLPKAYTLSSLDAFRTNRALNIQAGTQFCDSQFSREVATGTLKASSLERFSCVALAGVVTEYLRFGQSEGGLGDIMQLDRLFAALGFSQKKADGEVRWAVLNCAALLRDHAAVHDRLAEAMAAGLPVGGCIELIETELAAGAAAAGEDKAVHSRTPVT